MPDLPKRFTSRTSPARPRAKPGGSATARDHTAAYRRLREQVLSDQPLCQYCLSAGLVEAATVVDHLISLAIGGTNDRTNLVSSCTACNAAKAADEMRFLARAYDIRDVVRDPALAEWFRKARL